MRTRSANGSYLNSFFSMTIHSGLSVSECIAQHEQTFAHEYIHFLQDILLPYCIKETAVSNRYFAVVVQQARTDQYLQRPFDRYDADALLTFRQSQYTWGCGNIIEDVQEIIEIRSDFFQMPHQKISVYKFDVVTNDGISYQLGARDCLEYIAHKIESKNWNVNHPDFPYKSIDRLFEYYNLEELSPEVKICLVELSLYNDNPVAQLIFIIFHFVLPNKQNFKSIENCKHALMNFRWASRGNFNETPSSKSERRLNQLSESLQDKYNGNNFSDIKKWINHIIIFIRNNLSDRFIFTELFMLERDDLIRELTSMVDNIGFPLVFNSLGECSTLLPDSFSPKEFIPLHVASSFMEYITHTETKCPLHGFCSVNGKEIMDEKCISDPIGRSNYLQLCPFTSFLKNYGLHKVAWKNKEVENTQ